MARFCSRQILLFFLLGILLQCKSSTSNLHYQYGYDSEIHCDETKNCFISCKNESKPCSNSIINCPNNHQCNITCSSSNSCHNLIINNHHSSLLSLNINHRISSNISLYFPSTINNKRHYLQINPINIINKDTFTSKLHLHLFSINGWNDIQRITSTPTKDNSNIHIHGTMHCKLDINNKYTANCDFSETLSCIEMQHPCNAPNPSPHEPTIQKLCIPLQIPSKTYIKPTNILISTESLIRVRTIM